MTKTCKPGSLEGSIYKGPEPRPDPEHTHTPSYANEHTGTLKINQLTGNNIIYQLRMLFVDSRLTYNDSLNINNK